MTDKPELFDSESRRSFVKKSALAGSALALGASGSAAAQTDGGGTTTTPTDATEEVDAVIQVSNFHSNGRFNFASGVIDWTPTFPGVADDVWASYNTYMIRWLNTNEVVPLWVEADADLNAFRTDPGYIPDEQDSNQPGIWEMDPEMESIDDNNNVVQVSINPVTEEEEDAVLETDEFYDDQQGDGTATPTETTTTENETGS